MPSLRAVTRGPRGAALERAAPRTPASALGGCRVDHRDHSVNRVGGEASPARVLPDEVLARGDVDAEGLVAGDVALDPLHFRAEVAEHPTRLLCDRGELILRRSTDPFDRPL